MKSKEQKWKILLKRILPLGCRRILNNIVTKIIVMSRKDLDFFYDEISAQGALKYRDWAQDFCNIILKMFNPKSIIDFGCGIGVMLAPFEKKDIDILGIDGSKKHRKYSLIDKKNFLLFDLRFKYKSEKRYDLCFCFELAEHIEEKYSDVLVDSLTKSSSIIIFSAAPPGQGGTGHVNLKPYKWWIEKFQRFDFILDEQLINSLKKEIKNIPHIPMYYVDNLLVFKKESNYYK